MFDTGQEVGRTARGLYPGGHAVSQDHRGIPEARDETRSVVEARSAPAVFEGAFEHDGVLVRADVIERLPEGGWRLVEVKSSTRLKDVFVLDAAVQLWVLKGPPGRPWVSHPKHPRYLQQGHIALPITRQLSFFTKHYLTPECAPISHQTPDQCCPQDTILTPPAILIQISVIITLTRYA